MVTDNFPDPEVDARTRADQIVALDAIRGLYDDLALPPLYWTVHDASAPSVSGQVPARAGDEEHRRHILAAYAAHIGAVPHESYGFLLAEGRYRGMNVRLYTSIGDSEEVQQ